MNIFELLAPMTYWILIVLWTLILIFYLRRMRSKKLKTHLFNTLLIILAIDAFRTLFESTYFGAWYTSLAGFLPKTIHTFLIRPEMVIIPKLLNVIAAFLIITILIRRWIPQEEKEIGDLEVLVQERTAEFTETNKQLQKEIIQRKRAEEETRLAYTELDHIFNTSIAQCVIDKKQNILRVNDEFSKLFNIEKDKVMNKKCYDVFQISMCKPPDCPLSKIIQGEKPKDYEFDKKFNDGREISCIVSPTPYYKNNGELKGIVVTITDITARKQMEEQAKLHQEQLIQADKMASLGVLVSGVAHEINNPNSFITLNAPIFEKVWDNILPVLENHYQDRGDFFMGSMSFLEVRKMIPELLSGMVDGSKRINQIVSKLKDFARKEPADLDEEVEMNNVVSSALTLLDNMIKEATNNFSVDYSDNIPSFSGNSQQIEQVIVNLIINACQAIDDRNKGIAISTAFDSNSKCIVFTIRDEGKGIPKDLREKIFDPFFTSKRSSGGTGLGLSISSSIIQAHKGTIRVASTSGKGSTFTIKIPIVRKV